MNMKVAFFEVFLNIRGTSTAIYDYAHYNEKILGNESIVITQALHLATHEDACAKVYEKFQKRFPVFFLDSYHSMCDEIQAIVDREKPDVLYMLWKGGIDHVFRNVKTFVHCVFDPRTAYGDSFCVVSEWLNLAYHTNYPVVPHIVSLPEGNGNLRQKLGISEDAVVFGRYGGLREFDHPAAQEAVKRLSILHPHIYFLFMNTAVFMEPSKNVLFLDKTTEPELKARFIDTCDAMLYARSRGETFGLAIAEFSVRNKPIFAPRDAPEQMHKHVLKENAYWYTDADDLCALLVAFRPEVARQRDWNMYRAYSPERVMASFQEQLTVLTQTPPTACLAMIIKNEGPLLPRLFESVRGFVTEYCVVDTGSTDDTIEVLKSINMPGTIHEKPFVDFATTRNFLLQTCKYVKSDYLLLLDADMVLCASPEWDWAKLDSKVDVYNMIQVSSLQYENVRLIRTDATDIKVVGSTHEYYDVPSHYRQAALPKDLVYIRDVGDGNCKDDKFSRDERLLTRELAADKDNSRTVFYLANTLRDQGKYAEAIPYYVKRTQMGGFVAEADLSYTCLVQCYLGLDDVANAEKYASIAAYERTVPRAEPLYYLAFYLHSQHNYDLAWYYANMAGKITKPSVSQALFIHNDVYDFWIGYEMATLSQHVVPADLACCMHRAFHFLNNGFAPEYLKKMFVESTLAKYTPT